VGAALGRWLLPAMSLSLVQVGDFWLYDQKTT
jgi:hypothetical protein